MKVARARTHAAKRERPGREARAFTLYLLARQFRARLLKQSGLDGFRTFRGI